MVWATCNVGANSPEDYGNYFVWGETAGKAVYDKETLKYYDQEADSLTKYNGEDGLLTLEAGDDAAAVNWGGKWRMPTAAEFQGLLGSCTWQPTTYNEVEGYRVYGKNGNFIFLPAAGYYEGNEVYDIGYRGYYWSSSLDTTAFGSANYLYCDLVFSEYEKDQYSWSDGQSVRAVHPKQGLPTGVADGVVQDGTSRAGVNVRKVLENGTIYIIRDAKKYTIDGIRVK